MGEVPPAWEKACRKAVSKHFKDQAVELQYRSADNMSDERPDPGIIIYNIRLNDTLNGYAVITSAMGRHDYFDYLIIFNADLEIEKVRVFEYRSDHGYEICSKKWLKQFEGRSAGDFHYGKDIDAISGATLSASSLTKDISFICEYLPHALK